jgi:hypothetical protein
MDISLEVTKLKVEIIRSTCVLVDFTEKLKPSTIHEQAKKELIDLLLQFSPFFFWSLSSCVHCRCHGAFIPATTGIHI